MPLDSQSQALVDAINSQNTGAPPSLAEARRAANPPVSRKLRGLLAGVEDTSLALADRTLPMRIYRPRTDPPAGVLVYCHGGGFVLGGLNTCDNICCQLSALVGCVTVSVDYRLAPEHPFPAGVEDAYAATQWVIGHAKTLGAEPDRVAVGGDSAGATFATVVSMMARDRREPAPLFQLLFYPGINLARDTPERRQKAALNYVLSQEMIDWLNPMYVADKADFENPYCAPCHATDLSRLPPAVVIAAEFDPVRQENELYARRLNEAGVPCAYSEYEGTVHGFVSAFELIDKGRAALAEAAAALRIAFRRR